MNREILFKAKRKDWRKLPKKEWWVEGDLIQTTFNGIKRMWISSEEHDNARLRYVHKYVTEWRAIEIDPNTLCQFTGLTDKNGKKIWENDIVRGHNNDDDLARVVFGEFNVIDVYTLETVDRVVGWHTEVIETDTLSKCEPFCLPMPLTDSYIKRSEFEVFGNIFDNPELLEVE